jgi:hypothetical protein
MYANRLVGAALTILGVSFACPKTGHAAEINACNYAIGTDVSSIASGVNVSRLWSPVEYSSTINQGPVLVREADYPDPYSACNRALGSGTSFLTNYYANLLFGDVQQYMLSALQFDFAAPVTSFGFTGMGWSGDAIGAILISGNGAVLSYQNFSPFDVGPCSIPSSDEVMCRRYTGSVSFPPDQSVTRIVLGSTSSVVWIQSVSFSVPEPSELRLLAVGLLCLSIIGWRRSKREGRLASRKA